MGFRVILCEYVGSFLKARTLFGNPTSPPQNSLRSTLRFRVLSTSAADLRGDETLTARTPLLQHAHAQNKWP